MTAFDGLLAPYWDDTATGTMIGITNRTTKARTFTLHLCHVNRPHYEVADLLLPLQTSRERRWKLRATK